MSDELSMEIIENLSEELGQKELRIMELEKEVRILMNRNQDNETKYQFYQVAVEDMIMYREEGAVYEWEDGTFSSNKFDGTEKGDELRRELFLECCPGRETTVKEFIEELDDSNHEAIKTGRLEPMNLNDIQEMIISGEVIDTNDTNKYEWGYNEHPERSPLHSDTIIIVELD